MRNHTILASLAILILVSAAAMAQDDLRSRAGAALAEQDFATAARLFREHLAATPDDGAAHYQLGGALMALDELEAAQGHYERAGELGFQPLGVGYRLARIFARQGRRDAALGKLEEIAAGGFPMVNLITGEADFEPLHGDSRYEAAVAAMDAARFPCRSNENNRAFDFWIGSWEVTANGTIAGHNEVYPIIGDCVIFENWTSASGNVGKSFNFYDPGHEVWRQVWVSQNGSTVSLEGRFDDEGVLRYTGVTPGTNGGPETLHKLSFTPNEDGSVHQFWQVSTDGGESWTVSFDGLYVRQGDPQREIPLDR